MTSANTSGWILTLVLLGAVWLLGNAEESLKQLELNDPDRASDLRDRWSRRLPQKPVPVVGAALGKSYLALRLGWEWALRHPQGGWVYVLITLVGPTLLGMPEKVPKNWTWAILLVISAASVYGVHRTGRENAARDDRIVSRIRAENDAEAERIRAEERENADLREIEIVRRRRIAALREEEAGSEQGPDISL